MDFEKKLKQRLKWTVGYMAIGIVLIILSKISENDYLMTLGTLLVIMGIFRIIQYKKITKNAETIHTQEIEETDERNIAIIHKSKSMAFGIYVIIVGILTIVFEIMDKSEYASIFALNVCLLVAIYWICYIVYQKKS